MSNSRIPHAVLLFNSYIRATNQYQLDASSGTPNWTRLGWTTQNSSDWNTFLGEWDTDIFAKWSVKATRTQTDIDNLISFMKDFRQFAKPLLNLVAASPNGNHMDENIFHLVLDANHKAASHRTESIKEECHAQTRSHGGAEIEVLCRTTTDETKPSLPEGVHALQIFYTITSAESASMAEAHVEVFSSSTFLLKLGIENRGKWLNFVVRWYDLVHHEYAGPLSDVYHTVIR